MTEINRDRVERLAVDLLQPIRTNYIKGPTSRHRVIEALNALAITAASVIEGTEDAEAAQSWFLSALAINLNLLRSTPPETLQ